MESGQFAHDAVFYPGSAFAETHPDRLATIASLFGMQPASVPRCRVLELGCNAGANLIPMAHAFPESEFLGVDLSGLSIAAGTKNVAELGLKNIELRHCDIMDVTAEFGRFDYIIAHGVYSWVPPLVREKILRIFHDNLARQGVAYLSYNAYPGSHIRDLTRQIMLYHVRHIDDPQEKIGQSRAVVKFLANAIPADQPYGNLIRAQLERLARLQDEVLFHDDLSEFETPFLFSEVVAAAGSHRLQYVTDAIFAVSIHGAVPDYARGMLDRIPESAFLEREQYLDFCVGRWFRESLFCHDDIALERRLTPGCVKNYHLAAQIRPPSDGIDAGAADVVEFTTAKGAKLATDHRLSKAALLQLGGMWPQAIRFADLVAAALDHLGTAADAANANLDEEVNALSAILLSAFTAGYIELHLYPAELTTTISERPRASPLARKQAGAAPHVTNLRHASIVFSDAVMPRFLRLVDGTRNVDELLADLNRDLSANPISAPALRPSDSNAAVLTEVTRESVERNLQALATLGLLVA